MITRSQQHMLYAYRVLRVVLFLLGGRCTSDIAGDVRSERTTTKCSFDYITGKPEMTCGFFPTMKSNKALASLMFMQFLDSVCAFS